MNNGYLIIYNAFIIHIIRTDFLIISSDFTNFLKSFFFVSFLMTMIVNFIYPITIIKYHRILGNNKRYYYRNKVKI